jgi:hypothetical protein
MPTFKKQIPLTPEGEYTGIIIGAGQETAKNGTVRFTLPIHTAEGRVIRALVPFMEEYPGFVQNLVKSAGLEMPEDGTETQITPDDLERLQVWFGVVHTAGKDGRTYANVRFHQRAWAIKVNPALERITFPTARKPGKLRAVNNGESLK